MRAHTHADTDPGFQNKNLEKRRCGKLITPKPKKNQNQNPKTGRAVDRAVGESLPFLPSLPLLNRNRGHIRPIFCSPKPCFSPALVSRPTSSPLRSCLAEWARLTASRLGPRGRVRYPKQATAIPRQGQFRRQRRRRRRRRSRTRRGKRREKKRISSFLFVSMKKKGKQTYRWDDQPRRQPCPVLLRSYALLPLSSCSCPRRLIDRYMDDTNPAPFPPYWRLKKACHIKPRSVALHHAALLPSHLPARPTPPTALRLVPHSRTSYFKCCVPQSNLIRTTTKSLLSKANQDNAHGIVSVRPSACR
ncbi:hypothetical protein B0T16DRAFT_60701 [Cercophora newfieldiana]|uniref:Uncharacterized protein n=1 Tax=Cercophora newfieldiana TaxID=92897 RepID=A0AA39YRS6_9PEZI|nr:hypothetical protein B0T16DRAFT_60701 [Cercophora newfieldiana]